jgi:S-adenosylmethionine decarboxylase
MDRTGREKIRLSGFNNLTKVLSFNLYDFCIAIDEKQQEEYIQYINNKYSAQKISQISREISDIIDAQILNISEQDYDPVGASTLVLLSDIAGGKWEEECKQRPMSPQVNYHLDKSHITAHTYPDASDKDGICSFRVDIDIATCGEIIPLKAVNHLFNSFECDVVFIDYVVRGFTRTESGKKIYNDHYFNSIQDFIEPSILEQFKFRSDLNMGRENIWQTKLMVKPFGPERYLMEESDYNHPQIDEKMFLLDKEMREVFHLN